MIPVDDRGLLLGDGLFETLLAIDGKPQHFGAHMARMARGCAVLRLAPPSPDEAMAHAAAAPEASGLTRGRAVVRLTLTAGSGRGLERPADARPRLLASASPIGEPAPEVRLALVAIRRNETSPVSRIKSLSYLDNVLARAEARHKGAEEALMLNTRGELACAAAANLFWITEDRLQTPALECGVLDGIMRSQVVEAAVELGVQAAQVHATPEALEGAQAIFLTNSLIGAQPVAALDGRPIARHALVEAIRSRLRTY
jgi:branched-subunit amino acid aminotransferase/4-amino-4-deoxychorismate lyase